MVAQTPLKTMMQGNYLSILPKIALTSGYPQILYKV